jgi:hypothetical protein
VNTAFGVGCDIDRSPVRRDHDLAIAVEAPEQRLGVADGHALAWIEADAAEHPALQEWAILLAGVAAGGYAARFAPRRG